MQINRSLLFAAAFGLSVSAFAQTKQFTVGAAQGAKFKQTFTVESKTQVEDFTGISSAVSGWVRFDPQKKTGSGKLSIKIATIDTGIPLRNQHLQSADWLDAAKFPEAVFETTRVQPLSSNSYRVTGKLTLHGVTRTVVTDANVQYVAAGDGTVKAGLKGDVIRIKTSFPIKLSDYKIVIVERAKGKVSETVQVALDVFGTTGK